MKNTKREKYSSKNQLFCYSPYNTNLLIYIHLSFANHFNQWKKETKEYFNLKTVLLFYSVCTESSFYKVASILVLKYIHILVIECC